MMRPFKPSEVSLTALAAALLTRRWPQRNGHGRQIDAAPNAPQPPRSKGQGFPPYLVRCGERQRLAYFS